MADLVLNVRASVTGLKPVSVNKAYTTGMHGTRVLTAEGRKYKAAVTQAVLSAAGVEDWQKAYRAVYGKESPGWVELTVYIHSAEIYNKSFKPGGKTAKGEPQSPYKKFDGTNFVKLIEDAVVTATGIDDSANMSVSVVKMPVINPEEARVVIDYSVYGEE